MTFWCFNFWDRWDLVVCAYWAYTKDPAINNTSYRIRTLDSAHPHFPVILYGRLHLIIPSSVIPVATWHLGLAGSMVMFLWLTRCPPRCQRYSGFLSLQCWFMTRHFHSDTQLGMSTGKPGVSAAKPTPAPTHIPTPTPWVLWPVWDLHGSSAFFHPAWACCFRRWQNACCCTLCHLTLVLAAVHFLSHHPPPQLQACRQDVQHDHRLDPLPYLSQAPTLHLWVCKRDGTMCAWLCMCVVSPPFSLSPLAPTMPWHNSRYPPYT